MKVSELIEALKGMPSDAKVYHIWDGEPRTEINVVYLSKSGHVMTVDYECVVYNDLATPVDNQNESKIYETESPENYNAYQSSWECQIETNKK